MYAMCASVFFCCVLFCFYYLHEITKAIRQETPLLFRICILWSVCYLWACVYRVWCLSFYFIVFLILIWQKELEWISIFIIEFKCKLSCILFDHSTNRIPYRKNRTFHSLSLLTQWFYCHARHATSEKLRIKYFLIFKRVKCVFKQQPFC